MVWFLMDLPRKTFPTDSGDVGDLMGHTPAATRASGITFAPGLRGNLLSFASANSVTTTDAGLPAGAQPRTMSVRMTLTASTKVLFDYGSSPAGERFYMGPYDIGSGCKLLVSMGDGVNVQANTALDDGVEHHLAVTWAAGTANLYVDGRLDGTGATTGSTALSGLFTIVENQGGSHVYTLDDLQVYDRALTPSEIAREYSDPFWRLRKERLPIGIDDADEFVTDVDWM